MTVDAFDNLTILDFQCVGQNEIGVIDDGLLLMNADMQYNMLKPMKC